jgi:hypothetical protein
MMRT